MRIYFDTEFIEDGHTVQLVSLGAQDEAGRIYYAESNEFDPNTAVPWVQENVLAQLGTVEAMSNKEIARTFKAWVESPLPRGKERDMRPEYWAYFGAWDFMELCKLYGGFMNLPSGWPQNVLDIVQESKRLGVRLPRQTTKRHRADVDAVWTRDAHKFLIEYEEDLCRQNRFIVNSRIVQIQGTDVEQVII